MASAHEASRTALSLRVQLAVQGAVEHAGRTIIALRGRALVPGDRKALERAGMAAWEVTMLAVAGDEAAPAALRQLAMRAWDEKRGEIASAVAAMVGTTIGRGR